MLNLIGRAKMAAILVAAVLLTGSDELQAESAARDVQHRVMAFYYPWYGIPTGPGGAGQNIHWGRIDDANSDIAASTHYPSTGAYDSHDPNMIEKHCAWARAAGIDTLIVSWWGQGDYTDRAMDLILAACARQGLTACIYYEAVPKPQTPQAAARDIIRALERYSGHKAYLKAAGAPVVFIYTRAVGELGLMGWRQALQLVRSGFAGGVTAIGDQFSYGAARVFDGVHTYNTADGIRSQGSGDLSQWCKTTYASWIELADRAGRISTLTIIPGYDDTKIRQPGLAVDRRGGELYRTQWERAIEADPDWVLITSFNEWHEGSEIEPSRQLGEAYLDLTTQYAKRFKGSAPTKHVAAKPVLSPEETDRLRRTLKGLRIAVLPGAESTAFWWLLDQGVGVQSLTWEDVAAGRVTPATCSMLLYCGGETYRRTVSQSGDVDKALADYLAVGGFLLSLPSGPWPFYYDESGNVVNRSAQFGLTLRMGWDKLPTATLRLTVRNDALKHFSGPVPSALSTIADQRWRPFYPQDQKQYIPLLTMQKGSGENLGDAIAYAEPRWGGRVLYVWFALLETTDAESILPDVFTFAAEKLK
jgi:glycoprotein endo-alpha-1,2-mannosidase